MSEATTDHPGTPWQWRALIAVGVAALGLLAWLLSDTIGPKGRAFCGVLCFLGVAAAFSSDLRNVRLRLVGVGIGLQLALMGLVNTPAGYRFFEHVGQLIDKFLGFSMEGAEFVFGKLADIGTMSEVLGPADGFIFAFRALPTIIFISAFFAVLYHLGVMQKVVGAMAFVMRRTMGTGGAESLSASANVFMGQTEAPLLVRPYIKRMTQSQLLALMVGGMATVSGGLLVVYAGFGADKVALLTTSLMAAPAGLYVAKILLPDPEGTTDPTRERPEEGKEEENSPTGVIDAAAEGAGNGLKLALNVAAMLIVFIAFIAMVNAILEPTGWTLERLLGRVFSPVALLLGVDMADVPKVGELLGIKLVVNELVAFEALKDGGLADRSRVLATFALTGFANFSSIGIQIAGIGAMAPERRGELAQLGLRALLGGFLATLINAAIAGVFLAG